MEYVLWWCVATVTTVWYREIMPVIKLGRYVAIVYMGLEFRWSTFYYLQLQITIIRKDSKVLKEKKDKDDLGFFKKELGSEM